MLDSMQFEVRESFSTLLQTSISVTAKNEESYFFEVCTIFVHELDSLTNSTTLIAIFNSSSKEKSMFKEYLRPLL